MSNHPPRPLCRHLSHSCHPILQACNQLRCLECDCAVITFEGFQWSDNTDYLFLRNNYPVTARLRSRLNPIRGTRAYTCQCKHRSVNAATQLAADSELKWVMINNALVFMLNYRDYRGMKNTLYL
nr:protein C8orf37 homolog [Penaeus vannamei]